MSLFHTHVVSPTPLGVYGAKILGLIALIALVEQERTSFGTKASSLLIVIYDSNVPMFHLLVNLKYSSVCTGFSSRLRIQ
jgi:hypothetical protein